VAKIFGLRSHGLIFGTINNGFTIGATLGPVATGALFDVMGTYHTAFLVIAALTITGLIISLSLGLTRARD
jgi:cyanate permease